MLGLHLIVIEYYLPVYFLTSLLVQSSHTQHFNTRKLFKINISKKMTAGDVKAARVPLKEGEAKMAKSQETQNYTEIHKMDVHYYDDFEHPF